MKVLLTMTSNESDNSREIVYYLPPPYSFSPPPTLARSEQRLLSRCQCRLDSAHSQHREHSDLVERCTLEVLRLREEREVLATRLRQIDSDIQKVHNFHVIML